MPGVILRNIRKTFEGGRIVAVDGINLTINDGEYFTILGPSGCGKTTTLKLIAGLETPDEGEILIGGRLVNDLPPEDRGVGFLFQNYALFPHMTVWENVTYGPYVRGLDADDMAKIADEMLRMIGLRGRANAYPGELSGGMMQRVALARALAAGAKLLLLDEPLGALDPRTSAGLRHELVRFAKDLRLTVIHVTHDQAEAMAVSDRIAVMRDGKILQVGTPMELYLRPNRIFVANFVGEANFLEGVVASADERRSLVELAGGLKVRSADVRERGERVVAFFRPEAAAVKRGRAEAVNRLPGVVERRIFEGEDVRYEVRLKNEDRIVVIRPSMLGKWLDVGEDVTVSFNAENLLLYPYPKGGLERELALE